MLRTPTLLPLILLCGALSAGCASTPAGDAKPKYSFSKAYSTWAYAEAAFDYWAGLLRKRLDEAHGRTPPAS